MSGFIRRIRKLFIVRIDVEVLLGLRSRKKLVLRKRKEKESGRNKISRLFCLSRSHVIATALSLKKDVLDPL